MHPLVAVTAAVVAGVSLAVWGAAPETVTGGLSDPLWSAAFTAAALLLMDRDPLVRPELAVLLTTVTALAKNESFPMTCVLVAAVAVRERARLRRVLPLLGPVTAGAGWVVIARWLGLGSDLWLCGLSAVYLGTLVGTYMISLNGIEWYLATSVTRVSLPFALLACASAAGWGATAVARPPDGERSRILSSPIAQPSNR